MSSLQQVATLATTERRICSRDVARTLIYAALGENNVGMVLNVSEKGLAISTAVGVNDQCVSNIAIQLNGLETPVEVRGHIVWRTASKKRAGIEFIVVGEEDRERIREWISLEKIKDVHLNAENSQGEFDDRPITEPLPPLVFEAPDDTEPPVVTITRPSTTASAPTAMQNVTIHAMPSAMSATTLAVPARPAAGRASGSALGEPMVATASVGGPRDGRADEAVNSVSPAQTTRQEIPHLQAAPRGNTPVHIMAVLLIAAASFAIGVFIDHKAMGKFWNRGEPMVQNAVAASTIPVKEDGGTKAEKNTALAGVSVEHVRSNALPTETAIGSDDVEADPASTSADLASNSGVSRASKGAMGKGGAMNVAADADAKRKNTSSIPAPTAMGTNNAAPDRKLNDLSAKVSPSEVTPGTAAPVKGNNSNEPTSNTSSNPAYSNSSNAVYNAKSNESAPSVASPNTSTSGANSAVSAGGSPTAPRTPTISEERPGSANVAAGEPHLLFIALPNTKDTFTVKLTGEQLRLGSTAIHLERSVIIPADKRRTHLDQNGRLLIGEWISRVEPRPQAAGINPLPGDAVRVFAIIGWDGRVVELQPISGPMALIPSVMRAVRDWRYEPTTLNGDGVNTEMNITIEFQ
ncbi:MAG TPA: PilZ domain-containing protein [Candidatus Dormibacteraeota bacterium]|nr:PilZ domain-containing protein [Candidatus Dormibacteraeota bacterium]